jgi:hypothetical protein
MGLASLDPPPKFSTDLLAVRVAGRGIVPPISDIRWGTAATGGACTWFHVDSNGLGVFVIMKCGLKIWFFIRDDEGKFSIINSFHDFELDEAKGHRLEVVVLRPGTQLYVANYSFFYHYSSNLEITTGSCDPTPFMLLLRLFRPSVMEGIFIAPPQ